MLQSGTPAVYVYEFEYAHPRDGPATLSPHAFDLDGFAFHTIDCGFTFPNVSQLVDSPAIDLAKNFTNRWARFAGTGNPNGPGLVTWPPYSADSDRILLFDVASSGGLRTVSGHRVHACDYWDAFYEAKTKNTSTVYHYTPGNGNGQEPAGKSTGRQLMGNILV